MMGSSYLSASEIRALTVADRQAVASDTVIATLTWPADRPRLILDSEWLAADLANTAKGLTLAVDVSDGQGGWTLWHFVALGAGQTRGTDPPWMNVPAPPAGTQIRVRATNAGGTVTVGHLVRAGTSHRRTGL